MYVPTVPTTVPTVRARTIPTAVQYVLRTDIRANCTADARTYIYIEKKGNAAEQIGTYCTYMLYGRTAPTDVLTAFTYC